MSLLLISTPEENCRLAFGVNVTVMVQLAPAARLDPQSLVSEKFWKSPPPTKMPLIESAVVPRLVIVACFGGLVVPTFTPPKLMVPGDNFTADAVPVSGTLCGPPVP